MDKQDKPGLSWQWRGYHAAILLALLLAACSGSFGAQDASGQSPSIGQYAQPIESLSAVELDGGERLRVVATTTLVADLARNIGGESIELTTLLPYGADPHGYSATAQDLVNVSDADVVLSVGFDLESALLVDLTNSAPATPVVSLSQGIEPLAFSQSGDDLAGSEHEHDTGGAAPTLEGVDPHVWFDPIKMEQWAANSAQVFSLLDPDNQPGYQSRREQLTAEISELDRWIQQRVSLVPPSNRKLVTDHLALTYFADRYGFEVIGAVIPAYSSTAEVSAQELANLQDLIQGQQVGALFVGATANPALTERIGADLGVPVVRIYTGSLTPPEEEAGSYEEFMRHNVNAIVEALAAPNGGS